jgi:hypothetical protein
VNLFCKGLHSEIAPDDTFLIIGTSEDGSRVREDNLAVKLSGFWKDHLSSTDIDECSIPHTVGCRTQHS